MIRSPRTTGAAAGAAVDHRMLTERSGRRRSGPLSRAPGDPCGRICQGRGVKEGRLARKRGAYKFEKRQKELAKQKKRQEKLERKRKGQGEPADDDGKE